MKHITCYIDFISPYAYLAFEQLPKALEGLSYGVTYKPVLFAGMLKHHGQLGPAEIPVKRDWTYRHVQWLGHHLGIPLDLPAAHPFNPLPLLRLALACGENGACNRHVAETLFRHVWQGGGDAADADRLAQVTALLQPARDVASAEVKAELAANTQEAIDRGAFGVPSWWVDGKLIWGLDALPMLRECVQGGGWLAADQWERTEALPTGVQRPR
jgi:2-hydroxychromene-2-carboxylate isomerase